MAGVGNGKVLKSNANSKVFINFSDHGAPGLIAFPSQYLYADDLNAAISNMYATNMYNEMVLYIEACESGSMFEGLLAENINVYATTAANAQESSWGYYCYPDDVVNGVHINSCLGDLYSIKWMEDSDSADMTSESLGDQFSYLKDVTAAQQHAMEYGSLTFKSEPIGDFEGDLDLASSFFDNLVAKAVLQSDAKKSVQHSMSSAVDSRDAKLSHLYARVMTQGSHEAHLDMSEELTKRMKADHVFESFAGRTLTSTDSFPLPRNFDCLRATMNAYETNCHRFDDYSLKYVKYLVKACEMENTTVDMLIHRISTVCA
jgi:legumain